MVLRKAIPTIRDVAAAAGVSVTTVSRVLNERSDVSADTALRVQQVIEDLGFQSSLAARSLRSHRKHVIGLIVPDMDHTYAVEVIKAAGRAITDTHYDLVAMATGSTSLEDRRRWEQQQVSRLNGVLTDGVVVVVPSGSAYRTHYPLVALDPSPETADYPSVIADNYMGGLQAMRHLIGLGHRRIGYIGGIEIRESAVQRKQAWHDALAEAGIPIAKELAQPGDFARGSGAAAMRYFLALAQPPTAVFAANDEIAFGVMEVARSAGLVIPKDLSLVGFDNVPEAASTHPGLTTVDQGIEESVRAAFRMLIDLIDGRAPEHHRVIIPTRLIVRESCAPPRRASGKEEAIRP